MNATMVATAEEAIEILENSAVDIVLTDLMLPHTSGLELLKRVHDTRPNLPVIVLTQYGTIDSAVAATRMGAIDYVTKPFCIEELRARLERASRAVELQQENQLMREQLRTRPGFGGLIGLSERMQRVYKTIQKVSQHEYPVLILGESGTGKELVARSVHYSGARKDRTLVPVDCSSLVPTLIESELFGYVKGAFTGAAWKARTAGNGAWRHIVSGRNRRNARGFAVQASACAARARGETRWLDRTAHQMHRFWYERSSAPRARLTTGDLRHEDARPGRAAFLRDARLHGESAVEAVSFRDRRCAFVAHPGISRAPPPATRREAFPGRGADRKSASRVGGNPAGRTFKRVGGENECSEYVTEYVGRQQYGAKSRTHHSIRQR
jgi:CheY-like chemotaxis protein